MGPEFEMINGLKKLIINMMSSPDGYDSISLLNTLAVIFKEKNTLYKNIEKYITTDTSEKVATSNMLTLRTSIDNFVPLTFLPTSKTLFAIAASGGITLMQ
jgi:hypothetical protein